MDIQVFLRGMEKIRAHCGRAKLNDQQLDTYFDALAHIPNEAWRDIVEKILDVLRPGSYMPSRDDLRKHWLSWMQENPDRRAPVTRYQCDECNGRGRLVYWIWTMGQAYEYECGCARCQNWKAVFPSKGPNIPKLMTKQQIREMGGVLEDPMPKTPQRSETVATIEHAVDIALHDMPEAAVSF
jgi:hypothetical protein